MVSEQYSEYSVTGNQLSVNGGRLSVFEGRWQEVAGTVLAQAQRVQLLLTDCDGVLTDGGVYYSARGEAMKRYSIRDGMGVERLRKLVDVEVGIITGEMSQSLIRRAEKLQITELYLGVKDKTAVLRQIVELHHLQLDEVAYIGDDTNDIEIMQQVGLTACPADAIYLTKASANYICAKQGGQGAFREFAELIIYAKTQKEES